MSEPLFDIARIQCKHFGEKTGERLLLLSSASGYLAIDDAIPIADQMLRENARRIYNLP